MLSLNTNSQDLLIRRNLNIASNTVSETLKRMSTGFKVNSAKDDAAGMFVATKLNTQIRGIKQAQKNTQDGISYLNVAQGALSTMNTILSRLRDLSVQAANGIYDKDSRDAMQREADSLIEELNQIQMSTNFNGRKLFGTLDTGGSTTTAVRSSRQSGMSYAATKPLNIINGGGA